MSTKQTTFFGDGNIHAISIREEMRRSYIDYAMSVIVGRALPDVRDGLKPVHRRILYAMNELGMTPDKPYKKCARIVGEVLGKYHPHGDTAVYDALVRLAQDFSSRYPLIDGHGNFGSVEGDNAAAMRYTESRLTPISMTMLQDIDQDTVDFVPNFDGSLEEPSVLPCRLPMLLLNGSNGIAVGMATNIPPFNAGEVIDGVIATIDNPQLDAEELRQWIKGPDFPTSATIVGSSGIRDAFRTGRGSVLMRGVTNIELIPGGGGRQERTAIVITEIPYQVNLTSLIEKIAELVRDKKIEGISDIRNESDREGMRVVIELKRDAKPDVVLNNLYKQTQLQTTFGINMLALVKKQPRLLNLPDILTEFIEHRVDVVVRRTRFELNKAEARAHILAGLIIAIGDLDRVIQMIRAAESTEKARQGLIESYGLDVDQANAILEMQLRRLTGLEREKIAAEHNELTLKIAEFRAILGDRQKVLGIIKGELLELRDKFGDSRKTQILPEEGEFRIEDLTPNEPMAVFVTRMGYIKRIPLDTFERQNRATRGKGGIKTKDEDDVVHIFTAGMHDSVLFFSDRGVVYRLNVYDLPEGGRSAKGLPIINLLPLNQDEKITAIIPMTSNSDPSSSFIMLTRQGWTKRILLGNFDNIRRNGLIAIGLEEGDRLEWVAHNSCEKDYIIIGTAMGMAIRFACGDLRPLGRTARGVTAMKMRQGDYIIDFSIVPMKEDIDLLVVTTDGFGKRTSITEFRPQNRGGIGLIATKFKNATSRLTNVMTVQEDDELMIVSAKGVVVRLKAKDISKQGRAATGVRLQNLDEDDSVASVTKIIPIIDEDKE